MGLVPGAGLIIQGRAPLNRPCHCHGDHVMGETQGEWGRSMGGAGSRFITTPTRFKQDRKGAVAVAHNVRVFSISSYYYGIYPSLEDDAWAAQEELSRCFLRVSASRR